MENLLFSKFWVMSLRKFVLAKSWARYMESLLFQSPGPCHLEKSALTKSWARYMESLVFLNPGPCYLENLFMAIEFFNLQKGSFVALYSLVGSLN